MQGASRSSLAAARVQLTSLAAQAGPTGLGALSEELFSVATLLGAELQLRRSLADPSIAEEARVGLFDGLLGSRVSTSAAALLREMVRSRWSRPSDLAGAVETLAVQASFEQALAAGELDDVEDALFRFGRIIEREPTLRSALSSPSLPAEQKRQLLNGLLGGKVNAVAMRVITAAAVTAPRRRTATRALEEFGQLAASMRERVIARVTMAVRPDDADVARLGAALERVYGKRMQVHVEVNPQILGGVVVRVGDEVLDGSVLRRLEKARRELAPAH